MNRQEVVLRDHLFLFGEGMMREKIIKTERIYSGRILNLEILDVELPDGTIQKREVIDHHGAAAVVAIDGEGRVLLVRQFRSASRETMIEIPAGLLDPNETPIACAARELQEETGYKPGKIEALGGHYVAPGYTREFIHLFLATELSESKLPADADEHIEVERATLDEALGMIERGEIVDGKTIIGLLKYAARVKRG